MTRPVSIYCSGSIQKGPQDDKKLCWTDAEREALAAAARPTIVLFLNPDDPVATLDDAEALFGRDMHQVEFADVVVADARERRGIGIGIEMLASRLLRTALVVVAPPGSYYRKDNVAYRGSHVEKYVHPHLLQLADAVVDDFSEAGRWIREYALNRCPIKEATVLQQAIDRYKQTLLPTDKPMLEIMSKIPSR